MPAISLSNLPPARFVDHRDGYKSAYFTVGPEGGRPLVLCHGIAANGLQFVADANFFAARGFKVIVPDLRGHGRSTCPKVRMNSAFSIEKLAGDLVAVLDAENIAKTDWVGNSLGGIVALSLMDTNRNRLNSVTTFGTSYALKVPGAAIPLVRWGYRIFGTSAFAHLGAPTTSNFEPARRIIFEMLNVVDPDVVVRTGTHLLTYNLIGNALHFDRPILFIKAEWDRPVNAALTSTLTAMRGHANFTLVTLEEAGHCANLDQPDGVRSLILDFLAHAD